MLFVRFGTADNSRWSGLLGTRVRKIVGGDSPWPVSDEVIDLIKSQRKTGLFL